MCSIEIFAVCYGDNSCLQRLDLLLCVTVLIVVCSGEIILLFITVVTVVCNGEICCFVIRWQL